MHVQKLRLQKGWSQQQLADLSGLSVRTIQRIENGHTPSTESLKSLAAVFEIDFTTLQGAPEMPDAVPSSFEPQPAPRASSTSLQADELLALQHVRRMRGFYLHLIQYALVIGVLVLINVFVSPRYPWVIWPALGWGVGLLAHALRTFDLLPILGAQWERREVEKRLGRPLS